MVFTVQVTRWRIKYRRQINEKESHAARNVVDSLLNYETVKYFTNEKVEVARYEEILKGFEKNAIRNQQTLSLLNTGQQAIIAVGLIIVIFLAAGQVISQKMTIGDFILINTYLMQLYLPLNWFGTVYRMIKQSLIDIEDMFHLAESEVDIIDQPGARDLIINKGGVTFENIYFHYDARRPILENMSFSIQPHTRVAVVGASGAGKSTLMRLLFRFYDPKEGCIKIDGQNIKDVTQNSLRKAIGIVPQDTILFNDTIFYNIAYGKIKASKSEIIQAAKMAHIHDFILSLPDGYETMVGERGLRLSGGEKQRVAIARLILKKPAIYVFDEATSALDSKTEKDIQSSLWEISDKASTLMIAHRLSTIIDADKIIVMEKGKIIEQGTHFELLAHRQHYYLMWEKQKKTHDFSNIDET